MRLTAYEWAATAAEIDACRQQLRECERTFGRHGDGEPTDEFEADCAYLGYRLQQAHYRMLLLIERAGLPLFHADYMAGFSAFIDKLDEVEHDPYDSDTLHSEPLRYINQRLEALSALLRESNDKSDVADLALLERILRTTPHILSDRKVTPTSEAEMRRPVYDVLKVVFPDCRPEVSVPHVFKVYKADYAISSLSAMVEFKFAVDEEELRHQIDGIYADMHGYAGDPQWSRFFAVFYTVDAIVSPERMIEEFKLARTDMSWVPIIVHGPGSRKTRVAATKPKPKAAPKPRRVTIRKEPLI